MGGGFVCFPVISLCCFNCRRRTNLAAAPAPRTTTLSAPWAANWPPKSGAVENDFSQLICASSLTDDPSGCALTGDSIAIHEYGGRGAPRSIEEFGTESLRGAYLSGRRGARMQSLSLPAYYRCHSASAHRLSPHLSPSFNLFCRPPVREPRCEIIFVSGGRAHVCRRQNILSGSAAAGAKEARHLSGDCRDSQVSLHAG